MRWVPLYFLVITVAFWDFISPVSSTDSGETIAFVKIRESKGFGKRELNHFPEVLDVDVEFGKTTKKLQLEKQENLDVRKLKVSLSDGSVFKPKRMVAFYQDLANMAAIMVEAKTRENRLERTLTGTMLVGSKAYEIKPASKSLRMLEDILTERGLASHDSHMMHVLKEVDLRELLFSDDELDVPVGEFAENIEEQPDVTLYDSSSVRFRRAAIKGQKKFHVEMVLIADYSVFEFWETKLNNASLAVEEIVYFYTHIFNGQYMAFRNIDPAELEIVLWLTEIHIINVAGDAIVSQSTMVGNDANTTAVFESLSDYLALEKINSSYTDNVQLWTMKDLKVIVNNTVVGDLLGIAYQCGVCLANQSQSLNEDRGYFSWVTGAHELGHNLGSKHDNESSDCISFNYHIMTPIQVFLNAEIAQTALNFSSCSVQHFKNCLTGVANTNLYNFPRVCTYDTVCSHGKPLTDLDALPGQKFNLTEQCQLFIDPTSTYNNCGSNPCHVLYCADSNGNCVLSASSDMRAAVGTPCQTASCSTSDCVCYRGDCVPISDITNAEDHTPEQCKTTEYQLTGECLDSESWCPGTVSDGPWQCFEEGSVKNSCKLSCFVNRLFYVDEPPCAFTTNEVTSKPTTAGPTTSTSGPTTSTSGPTTSTSGPTTSTSGPTTSTSGPITSTSGPTTPETTTSIPVTVPPASTAATVVVVPVTSAPTTECIPLHWACDYYNQCSNGDDEDINWCKSLSCPEGYVACPGQETTGEVECIPESFPCDGILDCYYSNDENITWCENNGFPIRCHDKELAQCPLNSDYGIECIFKDYICDGLQDCYYSNEENITWCESENEELECYNQDYIQCQSEEVFECISWAWACDGDYDCPDGSDEDPEFCRSLECPEGFVRCPYQDDYWTIQCIPEHYFCDGYLDCYYYQDENKTICEDLDITPTCVEPHAVECTGQSDFFVCIQEDYFCDGTWDCFDGSDESYNDCVSQGITPTCYYNGDLPCPEPDEYGYIQCIPATWMCDGYTDCYTGKDETDAYCSSLQCPEQDFTTCIGFAGLQQCLPFDWFCDGIPDCQNGVDEQQQRCDSLTCNPGYIQCPENPYGIFECVDRDFLCDGYWDCWYSNEEDISWCLTQNVVPSCYQEGFIPCPVDESTWVQCINETYACDGLWDCLEGNDEDLSWCEEQGIVPTCFEKDTITCVHTDEFGYADHIDCLPVEYFCEDPAACTHSENCADLTCVNGYGACPSTDGYTHCINETYLCDGICDCENCTEENVTWCQENGIEMKCFYEEDLVCPDVQSNSLAITEDRYFLCIPPQWACDGYADCIGETDEDEAWCTSQCGDFFVPCPSGGITLEYNRKREVMPQPKSREINRKSTKGQGQKNRIDRRDELKAKETKVAKSEKSGRKTNIDDKLKHQKQRSPVAENMKAYRGSRPEAKKDGITGRRIHGTEKRELELKKREKTIEKRDLNKESKIHSFGSRKKRTVA